jgi:hypothetical protein
VLEASGYTVLRSDATGELVAVTMNWASPSKRNGRAVFDTLALWRGKPLTLQTGRIGYGYKQSHFSYAPIACNTVVVDGENHSMLRAEQVAMLEGDLPAARWLSPVQRPLYDGVEWARTAAVAGNTVVIIDQLRSDQPRRFDWVTYPGGKVTGTTIGGEPADWSDFAALHDQGVGYGELKDPRTATVSHAVPATVRYDLGDGATGRLNLLGSTDKLIRAIGWATWHPKQTPLVMQRTEDATEAWFVGAYTGIAGGDESPAAARRIEVTADGESVPAAEALAVEIADATGTYIVLSSSEDRAYRAAGRTLRGPLAVIAVNAE